jgi:hypothetical protein
METLNSAARAAGFAMAVSDEASDTDKTDAITQESEALEAHAPMLVDRQLAVAPVAPIKTPPSVGDWVKSWFGALGRGAPA